MISLGNVTKRYCHTVALEAITAEFCKNKIYCLLGLNGAGKTTLLKTIAGHINATSGQVIVCGSLINTGAMPKSVSFTQNNAVQFNAKVGTLLKMTRDLSDDFDYAYAQSMAKRFHLDENKKYGQLSFGMQTILTTLMGLAGSAKVLLLDEPVLGLDALARSKFYELLNDSFENRPRQIFVSTHLIDEITKSAQELIILHKGEIIFRSSVNDIDEKAYSITGRTDEVDAALIKLNVIGKKTIGGHTTAVIFDEFNKIPTNLLSQSIGLQEFFINMVGGDADEY